MVINSKENSTDNIPELLNVEEVCKMFNASRYSLNMLKEEEGLTTKIVGIKLYFLKNEIYEIEKKMQVVRKNYYSYNAGLEYLDKKVMPKSIKTYPSTVLMRLALNVASGKYVYLKKELEEYKRKKSDYSQHYSTEEAIKKLNAPIKTFNKLRKEEKLKSFFLNGKNHFLKKDIDNICQRVEAIRKEFCTRPEALNLLKAWTVPKSIKEYKIESNLWKISLRQRKGKALAYRINDIQSEINERELRRQISEVLGMAPYEDFVNILRIRQVSFSETSKHTEYHWLQHIGTKLKLTKQRGKTLNIFIKHCVEATAHLAKFTHRNELYLFSTNEINLALLSENVMLAIRIMLYSFLIEYERTVRVDLKKLNASNTKLYDGTKLNSPYKHNSRVTRVKDTYEHSEYLEIYSYTKDMSHKKLAIIDAEKTMKNAKNATFYSSAWAYTLIHLTNAWRHNDVLGIPKIDLTELGEEPLKTLKKRDLTIEESNIVINQLKRSLFIANKTGAKIKFQCADDLVLPLATALVICNIITEKTMPAGYNSIIYLSNDYAAFYQTKGHAVFFRNYNGIKKGFQFKSMKMNRTVLVLTYLILTKEGKGGAALQTAQRLRGHKEFETTNQYLELPRSVLDKLCESLFDRGNFGYIPDLLATTLLGNSTDREKRTKEIITVSNTFGGIEKIEATAGFINKVLSERQIVAEQIFNLGIDKTTELLFDINSNMLPSHIENVQCIVAEKGCKYIGRDCLSCPFAIPNFYAISALVTSVKDAIKEFVEDYDQDSGVAEKTRLMNFLYIEMDNFERAIQKFGKDEVFKFFEGGEEEYNNLLNLLDAINTNEDLEKYLTFTPVHLS